LTTKRISPKRYCHCGVLENFMLTTWPRQEVPRGKGKERAKPKTKPAPRPKSASQPLPVSRGGAGGLSAEERRKTQRASSQMAQQSEPGPASKSSSSQVLHCRENFLHFLHFHLAKVASHRMLLATAQVGTRSGGRKRGA
jgi:hypothetical protein